MPKRLLRLVSSAEMTPGKKADLTLVDTTVGLATATDTFTSGAGGVGSTSESLTPGEGR